MRILLGSAVDVAIMLGIALAAAAVVRHRSAALRHWILTVAVGCSLAAPALEIALPAWQVPLGGSRWTIEVIDRGVLARVDTPAGAGGAAARVVRRAEGWLAGIGAAVARQLDTRTLLPILIIAIWMSGTAVALALLLVRLTHLRDLARQVDRVDDPWLRHIAADAARRCRITRPIVLLQSPDPAAMIVTWGLWKPRVLLPAGAAGWNRDRLEVVFAHELAHVRRNDWAVQLAASLLRCVYWFNPLVWIASRALRRESERACDDLVLKTGVAGAKYATHLVAVARDAVSCRRHGSTAAAIAHPSTLEERVRAMLNARLNREPMTDFARIAIGTVLTVGAMALAAGTLSREASAQAGGFGAVVYDQSGGLLPSVDVSITQAATGRTYQGTTDGEGSFAVRDVPAGVYEVAMGGLPGFATVRATIDLSPGDFLQRNIVLPLGTIEETITIVELAWPGAPSPSPSTPTVRPARQIPQPRIPNTAPGSIGGNIRAPRKLVKANPIFPAELGGSSAMVIVSGRIGIDGFLVDLKEVSGTEPHPAFVSSLLAAAYKWEFMPTLLNGAPVETNITITARFDGR